MQQTYAGKDIARFIAAILWIIMGIIYVTYVFDLFGDLDELSQYKGYGKAYDQVIAFYWIMIAVYVIAAVIVVMAAIYMFKEDTNKFGTVMYCYATGYIITVVILLIYLSAITNGEIVAAFSYLGSSFGKYMAVLGIAAILVVASVYAEGINYKKASRGVAVGNKSFVPLVIYLSSMICILIIASMLKNDFGEYVNVSDIFGETLKSQSGGGIALIIGIHITCGLYIFLREKYFIGGSAYGSMGYGMNGYGAQTGMPPYGMPGQGMPPYGMPPYGMTGQGMPPYGATGYGVPPYAQNPYSQPMGMVPGMMPMGMVPPLPMSKHEMAKIQSEKEFILKKGGWICCKCKKANYSYVGSCACGMTRDESEKKEKEEQEKAISEMNERIAKSRETDGNETENKEEKEVLPKSVLEASTIENEEKIWECLSCHTVNDEHAKSCKNCGQIKAMGYKNIKALYCPNCGALLDASSKFCYKCGQKIG